MGSNVNNCGWNPQHVNLIFSNPDKGWIVVEWESCEVVEWGKRKKRYLKQKDLKQKAETRKRKREKIKKYVRELRELTRILFD